MKKFMLVIVDRFDVSMSNSEVFESNLSDLKDVLINKICEIWEIDVDEFDEKKVKVGRYVGVDFEGVSFLLIEL